MKNRKNVLITTGDADGIGLEVTVKSLLSFKTLPKEARLIFFRSRQEDKVAKNIIRKLKSQHTVQTCTTLKEALLLSEELSSKKFIIEVISDQSPAAWVEASAKACFEKRAYAMVTAPLSKQSIKDSGYADLGHTDILKRVCGAKFAFMGFVGKFFNVVLITGHIPIVRIETTLTAGLFAEATRAAQQLQKILTVRGNAKPFGMVGLNPHAGDGGLIGDFDRDVLSGFVATAVDRGIDIQGPLVPDACFQRDNWNKYSLYLCCYHDQGLIPFKMAHGHESGVHVTLGLPILRTSVDHGTAKDIYGKNKAKPQSMTLALQMALKL